jgi:hypothetical protein
LKAEYVRLKKQELIFLVTTVTIGVSCGLSEATTPATVEVDEGLRGAITEMPMPTPTTVPQSAPLFQDDFEAGEGEWFVEELPEHSMYVSRGEFIIEVQESQWNAYSGHADLLLLDTYALEVDISYVSGPTESEAGIAFRCDVDDEAWVELSFDAEGLFTISSVTYGEGQLDFVEIIPYALVPALRHGQSTNHIRLVDDDTLVTVYINDELVASFPYEDLPPGCPSFFAGTYEDGGAKWAFDNVFVWEIERSGDANVPAPVTALAKQVSSLTMQGLRIAVGAPPLAHLAAGPRLQASITGEGIYRVECPEGGYMEMMHLPEDLAFAGEVELDNAVTEFSDCSYMEEGSQYTSNGTLTVNGSYYIVEDEPQEIVLAGDLVTSPGEDCPVHGRVAADGAFAGTICAWPITIDPIPPPPSADTPADLLAGPWSGRATYRETVFGCSGTADFTFTLEGSGESIDGTYTYTVGPSIGPDPLCSRSCDSDGIIGCSIRGSLNGTARNGKINFTAGGLVVEGSYRHDGQWMAGSYEGSPFAGIFVIGDWQTILK